MCALIASRCKWRSRFLSIHKNNKHSQFSSLIFLKIRQVIQVFITQHTYKIHGSDSSWPIFPFFRVPNIRREIMTEKHHQDRTGFVTTCHRQAVEAMVGWMEPVIVHSHPKWIHPVEDTELIETAGTFTFPRWGSDPTRRNILVSSVIDLLQHLTDWRTVVGRSRRRRGKKVSFFSRYCKILTMSFCIVYRFVAKYFGVSSPRWMEI